MDIRDIRSLALEAIIAADPRLSIDKTLRLLVERTDASEAGLFVVRTAGPELIGGRGVDHVAVERVRATWRDDEQGLQAGQRAVRDRWCVWPLAAAHRTTGLVYVGSQNALKMDRVREAIVGLGELLVIALELDVTRASAAIIDSYLETTTQEEIERRQLVALLAANEWNIARVSRIIGVTRRTIYNRLERLGIDRLHVEKALT